MKKILFGYINIFAYVIVGLAFGFSFFLLFLNFYHYKEVNTKINVSANVVDNREKTAEKLNKIKTNASLYQQSTYNGKNNMYDMNAIQIKLNSCVKIFESEEYNNLANKEMVIKSAKEDLDAYYSGNTQYYEDEQNLLLNQLEQLNDSDKEKYEKYWNILAYNRNIFMKDTLADSIHNNKHDFIGVGCKHLYGKKGIIQLLKDDGYLVECMK